MNSSLARTRIVLAGCGGLVLALLAGGIFDRWIMVLTVAAVLPTALALVVRDRQALTRLIAAVAALVASVVVAVVASGGTTNDLADSFGAGVQRMLSTDWPSPDRPDLIGTIALLIATSVVLATELARQPRWHLLPLAPLVLCHLAITGLSAPLGVRLHWLAPLAVLFAVFATLKPRVDAAATSGEGVRQRLASLRGEWRVIPLVLVGALVAFAVSVPATAARRADPRRNDPAIQTAALLDPIESTLAMRALDPPRPIYRIGSDAQLPTRWRTSALDGYDGQRWTPALTIRPIGRRLGPDTEPSLTYTVEVLDASALLLPLAGSPITADGRLETDENRTVVRLAERLPAGELLEIRSAIAPTSPDAGSIGTRQIDDRVSGLTPFATELAGDGTVLDQLRTIESAMRNDFVLASNATGAGQQQALIERFLRDTQRGTAEQFATGFVLLARSLGVDARVATGFMLESNFSTSADGSLTLTSRDAMVWPEVRVIDAGWVAFNPVPEEEDSNLAPPPEAPAVQTPAAAQPPIAPPVEPEADSDLANVEDGDEAEAALSSIGRWATRVAWGFALLVLPVIIAIVIVLTIKRRRRRRRLEAVAAAGQINGAWAVATDRLVDAGLSIPGSATNGEIAVSGRPLAPAAERELERLANLSSSVTFGDPARPDLLAQDAASCLERVETSMAEDRSRLDRLRWELSLRSLRRSTRSPVRSDVVN